MVMGEHAAVQDEKHASLWLFRNPSSCPGPHLCVSLHNRLHETWKEETEHNKNSQALDYQEKGICT